MVIVLHLFDASFCDEKNELKTQSIPIYRKVHVITQLIDQNNFLSNVGLTMGNSFSKNHLFTKMYSGGDVFFTNFAGFQKSLNRDHPSMSDEIFSNALLHTLKSFHWSVTDNLFHWF